MLKCNNLKKNNNRINKPSSASFLPTSGHMEIILWPLKINAFKNDIDLLVSEQHCWEETECSENSICVHVFQVSKNALDVRDPIVHDDLLLLD